LYQLPASFSNKPALSRPVYEAPHGDDEKKMGDLVGIDTLYAAMALGRQGLIRDENHQQK